MHTASLNEIKKELQTLEKKEILEICLRIIKYKKDNKELLSYLLFEQQDESAFIQSVKVYLDEQFEEFPQYNLYLVNKMIRKVMRTTAKFIKYSGSKQTEAELILYFCEKLKKSRIKIDSSTALSNFYQQQLKKIEKAISKLHEDLQYDFQQELNKLY
jgi:hypothetical protein